MGPLAIPQDEKPGDGNSREARSEVLERVGASVLLAAAGVCCGPAGQHRSSELFTYEETDLGASDQGPVLLGVAAQRRAHSGLAYSFRPPMGPGHQEP